MNLFPTFSDEMIFKVFKILHLFPLEPHEEGAYGYLILDDLIKIITVNPYNMIRIM